MERGDLLAGCERVDPDNRVALMETSGTSVTATGVMVAPVGLCSQADQTGARAGADAVKDAIIDAGLAKEVSAP